MPRTQNTDHAPSPPGGTDAMMPRGQRRQRADQPFAGTPPGAITTSDAPNEDLTIVDEVTGQPPHAETIYNLWIFGLLRKG